MILEEKTFLKKNKKQKKRQFKGNKNMHLSNIQNHSRSANSIHIKKTETRLRQVNYKQDCVVSLCTFKHTKPGDTTITISVTKLMYVFFFCIKFVKLLNESLNNT